MLQALQEPYVNLRQFLNALYRVALLQCLCDSEDTQVGGVLECIVQIIELRVVVAHEAVHALANHAQTFLHHLLERAADRHNFTDGLHRGTDLP